MSAFRKESIVRLRLLLLALFLALLLPAGAPPGAVVTAPGKNGFQEFEDLHGGKLLVAAPGMRDPRFRKTVIVMLRHNASGAFGLIVNRVVGSMRLSKLFAQLKLAPPAGAGEVPLHYGGPVGSELGFVLHSREGRPAPTHKVNKRVGVSPVKKVLEAMAGGGGPRRTVFIFGYSGWGPGQLDAEMERGDWFTAPVDEEILFGKRQEGKWKKAMESRFRTL
ncbi:MAG: YqgE/AlgH family protein [bacterium]